MEVRTIALSPDALPDYASLAASVIGQIGEAGFAGELISSLARHLRVGHLSAFACRTGLAPQLLGTGSVLSPGIAYDTAVVYLDRHYLADPTRTLRETRHTLSSPALFVQRQRSQEVLDDGYRTLCYDRPGIIDRVSAVQTRRAGSDTWIAVNIYRDRSQGFFSDSDIDVLSTVAPIVTRATERHLQMMELQAQLLAHAAASPVATRETASARLVRRFPQLSRREREVCGGILDGLTAKQIARRLEIAPTSVVTHRKNAYLKLGIHDLKQLFTLAA